MYVLDEGDGPAVVLVPGLGADHRLSERQLRTLAQFRLLAVDLRGTGRSPSLDGIAVDDILAVQADDLAAALDERSLGRAHFVGISYGGPVIETFMLRHPERIASAVLCDSLSGPPEGRVLGLATCLGAAAQPAMLRRLPASWNAAMVRMVYRRRWPEAARYLGDVLEEGVRTRVDDLVAQRRAVNAVRLTAALEGCEVPTLCLVGDYSRAAIGMMRSVADALPRSEFAIIDDSFDPSNLCRPEEFDRRVREWVLRQEPAAPEAASR